MSGVGPWNSVIITVQEREERLDSIVVHYFHCWLNWQLKPPPFTGYYYEYPRLFVQGWSVNRAMTCIIKRKIENRERISSRVSAEEKIEKDYYPIGDIFQQSSHVSQSTSSSEETENLNLNIAMSLTTSLNRRDMKKLNFLQCFCQVSLYLPKNWTIAWAKQHSVEDNVVPLRLVCGVCHLITTSTRSKWIELEKQRLT